jgi:hypothetical protein
MFRRLLPFNIIAFALPLFLLEPFFSLALEQGNGNILSVISSDSPENVFFFFVRARSFLFLKALSTAKPLKLSTIVSSCLLVCLNDKFLDDFGGLMLSTSLLTFQTISF